jgi:hypothetical protein
MIEPRLTQEGSFGTASNAYLLREAVRRHGIAPSVAYTREDALFDMLDELPTDAQIADLVSRLRVSTLRNMTTDLLKYNVAVAKDHALYPYMFCERLSSWLATAQEVLASRKRLRQVLKDRNEMRRAHPDQ